LFAWHRKTQLQEYVRLISRMQRRDLATVTKADLLNDYNEGKKSVITITDRVAPDLADLALTLKPDQIDNIEKKLAKGNDKFRKDYLTGSLQDRQDFRYKKMMKQAEYWFGDFSKAQEARLRALSDARPLNNELVMADRLRRQQELITLLRQIHREKPNRETTTALIRKYIASTMDHFGDKAQQAFFDASNDANANLVAEMMHMATPDQKKHFVLALQDWVTDFNRLMAKADS
jgi:phosphatidate phosphatase PAH1